MASVPDEFERLVKQSETNPFSDDCGAATQDRMPGIHPTVRYLIVCEDVKADPNNPFRVSLVALIGSITSLEDPPYPFLYEEFCVFLQITGCRGRGEGRIEIRFADTDEVVFQTKTRTLPLSHDPLELVGVVFRIRDCLFPEPGLYWVQFWYNEEVIAQQPVLLR